MISLRGPRDGGVIITRKIHWQGERLLLNADANRGKLKVRISNAKRKVLGGFDYDDCIAFNSDSVQHEVRWKKNSIDSLKGRIIRLEFFLQDADLFTFRSDDSISK